MPELKKVDALWLVALVALVVVFFYQFAFLGRIPVNSDWLHANFEPGRAYMPELKPHNYELDDPSYQFHPLRLEALRQWRSGHVPLWNPRILCGTPLLADGIAKPFDPLIVAQLALGNDVGLGAELMLQFVLMVTGMYVLARALGLPPAGAAAAAVVYSFNLLSVTWMEERTATGSFAFFPWAFLFLHAALARRRLIYAALAGLFVAFMHLGGHPQFTIYGDMLLCGYALWRAIATGLSGGAAAGARVLGLGVFGMVLGAVMSAVETVPFLELVRNSERSGQMYAQSNAASGPLSFITYFFPNIFGNPARGPYIGGMVLRRSYMVAVDGFTGASTLVFAIAGLYLGRVTSKRFFVFVWLAVPVVLLTQQIDAVARMFASVQMARAVFMSNFAVALIAGAGVAALTSLSWKDARLSRLVAALAVVFVVLALYIALLGRIPWVFLYSDGEQLATLKLVVALITRASGSLFLWPGVYVPLAFFAAGAALVALSADLKKAVAPLAAALVALELMLAGVDYNPFVPRALIAPNFPPVAAVKAVAGPGARILGVDTPPEAIADESHARMVASKGDFLIPNGASLYGLDDVRGDESLRIERYFRYVARIAGPDVNLLANIHLPVYQSRFLDALGARFVMSAVPLKGDGLKEIFNDGRAFVYENSRALPRAWMVGAWRRADSGPAALAMLHTEEGFDPRTTAVVEPGGAKLPEPPAIFAEGAAEVTSYEASRVEVATNSEAAALLVLADAYYPGWRATVDGATADIMPADCALRGVHLAPGSHKVVFSYEPASFRIGAGLSLAGLGVLLAIVAVSIRKGRKAAA